MHPSLRQSSLLAKASPWLNVNYFPCLGFAIVTLILVLGSRQSYSPALVAQKEAVQKEAVQKEAVQKEASLIQELYDALQPERLAKIAKKYKQDYAQAEPFPHIAIDGIFPERFLAEVLKENPESLLDNRGCLKAGTSCFKSSKENKKSGLEKESRMGLYTRILFAALKSSIFCTFLEDITAISNIIPDPHYLGSGLHFTSSGGNLDVHADFNRYERFGLDRRVNSFIFLNDNWEEDYGGHLELWSKDMKACHQRIKPVLGRFVVFSSTDFSYHGHPKPLTAPAGRARRSMALYYYTNGRPASECLNSDCSGKGHSTLFQRPVGCQMCEDHVCKAFDEKWDAPQWSEQRLL